MIDTTLDSPLTKEIKLTKALNAFGFTLETLSGPRGVLEPATTKDGKPWQCLRYSVLLKFNGREIIETNFSFGIGHVNLSKERFSSLIYPSNLESMFYTMQRKPLADFVDKDSQFQVLIIAAKRQKLAPTLPGVLYSLLMDSSAYGQTFEDWCGDLGYDSDSRKAEEIFKACEATGRKLSKIDTEVIEQARELLQDY